MNKGLTTQEQIALAKEILQVNNRRERSLKLGEILDREKLSSDDMYELYNTLLTAIRVYGDVIGFDDKDFQEMTLTILVLEKVEEAKEARVAQRGAIPLLVIARKSEKNKKQKGAEENKMLHHYITTYKENGRCYAEAWFQIDIFGKSFCLSKKRICLDAQSDQIIV